MKIVEQNLSKQTARRMGPCVRRDDSNYSPDNRLLD